MAEPKSDATGLHATLTALSPDGWEVRIAGACRYLITTTKEISDSGKKQVAGLFHPETDLEFVEGEFNDD